MTLQELSKYYDIQMTLEKDREALENLRQKINPASPQLTGMPHTPGVRDKVADLALELVEKAELSIMGSGQGAKKKKQVFAALRTKCPAAIRWAITDEVLDTVIEHAFDVMTAALGKKS